MIKEKATRRQQTPTTSAGKPSLPVLGMAKFEATLVPSGTPVHLHFDSGNVTACIASRAHLPYMSDVSYARPAQTLQGANAAAMHVVAHGVLTIKQGETVIPLYCAVVEGAADAILVGLPGMQGIKEAGGATEFSADPVTGVWRFGTIVFQPVGFVPEVNNPGPTAGAVATPRQYAEEPAKRDTRPCPPQREPDKPEAKADTATAATGEADQGRGGTSSAQMTAGASNAPGTSAPTQVAQQAPHVGPGATASYNGATSGWFPSYGSMPPMYQPFPYPPPYFAGPYAPGWYGVGGGAFAQAPQQYQHCQQPFGNNVYYTPQTGAYPMSSQGFRLPTVPYPANLGQGMPFPNRA